MHQEVNIIESGSRDRTLKSGLNQIERVCLTEGVLQNIKECRITNFEEIRLTNCREFIFDINIKSGFSVTHSSHDRCSAVKLDPNRRSHLVKFKENLDEYLNQMKTNEMMMNLNCK